MFDSNFEFISLQFLHQVGPRKDMRDDSAEIISTFFSAEGRCDQFWHGLASRLTSPIP